MIHPKPFRNDEPTATLKEILEAIVIGIGVIICIELLFLW